MPISQMIMPNDGHSQIMSPGGLFLTNTAGPRAINPTPIAVVHGLSVIVSAPLNQFVNVSSSTPNDKIRGFADRDAKRKCPALTCYN
jgi:hypothetical protein